MINKHDPEIFLGLSRDKEKTEEKLIYVLQSIAASLIVNKIGISGSEKFVEKISDVVGERHEEENKEGFDYKPPPAYKEVKETDAEVVIRPLACSHCLKKISQEKGKLVYWYGSESFCSGEHRTQWMDANVKEQKPMSKPSSSGGVL